MTLKFEHKEVVRSGSFVTLKNRRGFLRAGFEIEMHLKLGGAGARQNHVKQLKVDLSVHLCNYL